MHTYDLINPDMSTQERNSLEMNMLGTSKGNEDYYCYALCTPEHPEFLLKNLYVL